MHAMQDRGGAGAGRRPAIVTMWSDRTATHTHTHTHTHTQTHPQKKGGSAQRTRATTAAVRLSRPRRVVGVQAYRARNRSAAGKCHGLSHGRPGPWEAVEDCPSGRSTASTRVPPVSGGVEQRHSRSTRLQEDHAPRRTRAGATDRVLVQGREGEGGRPLQTSDASRVEEHRSGSPFFFPLPLVSTHPSTPPPLPLHPRNTPVPAAMNSHAAICEFVGTLVFYTVVLRHAEIAPVRFAPLVVVSGLFAAILFNGGGGHYNSGVSLMMLLQNTISKQECATLVATQLLAGFAAVQLYKRRLA